MTRNTCSETMLSTAFIIYLFIWAEAATGPEFVKVPPETKTFTNNSGATIECLARGDPPPTVTWVGLDQRIIHTIPGIRKVWHNGTIEIVPFSAPQYRVDVHATSYRCKAANTVGTILAPSTSVRAVVVQELEVELYDEYVTTGNSVILTCVVPAFIRDFVTVTSWQRDDSTHIYPSLHGDGKYHVVPDGRLLVHRVQTSDSHQTFRCRVLHTLTGATATSNSARIIVNDATDRRVPRMVTKDATITVDSEAPVTVPCVAQGHPSPRYRWFLKNGRSSDPISLGDGGSNPRGAKLSFQEGVLVMPTFPMDLMPNRMSILICEAFNVQGAATMEVRIVRSNTLAVSLTPKLLIVDSGSNGDFRCSTGGKLDEATITWYKNGRVLSPSGRYAVKEDGKVLHIASVETGDSGMFQCFVKVGNKIAQSSAELRLGASPPRLMYRFIQQTLTPGPPVSLKCIAKASPTPVFDWFLDGFPLPPLDRVLVGQYVTLNGEVVSHVNISRSKVIDGGEYTCRAQNSVGAVEHSANLYIYGPPQIRNTGTLTAIAGESFKVKCPVAGYPIASVVWRKGGRDLPLNKRHRTSGAVLQIEDVIRDYDEGDYTCVASDKHGRRASQRVTLKVVVPPTIKPFEFGRLVSGMRAQATCLVQTGDPPVQVFWLRDGDSLMSGPELTLHQMDSFTSILILPKVLPRHSGNYTCVARNQVKEETFTARLDVRVAPFWREDPKDIDVIKGKNALLSCIAEGYPVPKVIWRKTQQGNANPQHAFHGVSRDTVREEMFSNGTLLIREVTESDEGAYLCEVSNKVGKGLSAIISLKVHAPPQISGEENIQARRGDAVVFECRATGDPPLALTFSRDGHPVDPSNVRYIDTNSKGKRLTPPSIDEMSEEEKLGEYHLQRVTPLDSGKYMCTGTNPYGSQTFTTNLLVQDAPNTPHNLRATDEGSRSVFLSWSHPDADQSAISYYLLLIKELDADQKNAQHNDKPAKEVRISSDKTSYTLKELNPHTSYQIHLVAVNNVGQSPPSDPLVITTEGEAPSAAPRNVRATPISSREVEVQWTVPDKSSWHGKILGYYVGHKKPSDESFVFEMTPPPSDKSASLVLRGLDRYTEYGFVVRAFNVHGQGPLSKEIHATTHEDIPQAPPNEVSCVSLTSSRLEVTWKSPPQKLSNGQIISYTLSYVPIASGSFNAKSQVVTDVRVALGSLTPFTNYSISVAGSTRAGVGVPSEPIICTTDEGIPDPPSSIKAVVSGTSSVVVAWSPPSYPRGVLTKYTLFFQLEGERKQKRRTVPPTTKWLEVTGLAEGLKVHFWMTASTRVGEGTPTRRVTAAPTKAVPAGIHMVNSRINVAKGTDVLFTCPHSGYPPPKLTWRINGRDFSNELWRNKPRWVTQNDGNFLIRDVKKEDYGNFTCHVTNYHGSDEITISLHVLTPPSAFRLHAVSSSPDSLKVSWESGEFGGSPIHRLALIWKPASGEWRELSLPWQFSTYTLSGLSCGTQFQLYLTAYNDIGPGEASTIVTIRTKGNQPTPPTKERILFINPSSASLLLSSFTDPDCPVKEYYVRLKSSFSRHWIIESGRLPGDYKEYVLPNLKEKTKYTLEVVAINDAGEGKGFYTFYTTPMGKEDFYEVMGGELSVPQWNEEQNLYQDPAFIIPVIISCLALIVIASAIGICCLKKPVSDRTSSLKRNEKLSQVPVWKDQNIYGTVRKSSLPIPGERKSMGDSSECTDSEIRPYATFQPKHYDDLTMTSSMQTYGRPAVHAPPCRIVHQDHDPKNHDLKNLRPRPRSLSRGGSDYARGRNESDDYESGYTDSDADTLPSSKTGGYARSMYQPFVVRSAHHNMLYVASDVSSIQSPEREKKSLPRKIKGR